MRDPVGDLDRRGRMIFAAVLLFAISHATLYVITVPTWDLFDEEQHLSYALYLIDNGEIPRVNDPIQQRILDSAVATDRWSTLRIGRPVAPELNEFGLEGWSYEGYHPPLYYAVVSPLTLLSGQDAWRELYAARIFGILLMVALAGVCWGYARDWLPDADPAIWGTVVAMVVSIPAVAASAGRVNNDLLTGLLLASGLLMATRVLEDPRIDNSLLLGLLAAGAVLTKGQGAVLLLVAVAACSFLLFRRQSTPLILVLALLPGLAAFGAWTLWTWTRYETINSSEAFLDLVGATAPLGVVDFAGELWLNGWSSYWGAYDGGFLRWITGLLLLVMLAAGLWGIAVGSRPWWKPGPSRDKLVLTGVLLIGLLGAAWVANDSGLAHPHGRMFIGAFPALATLSIAGIRRLAGDIAAIQTGIGMVALSSVYFLYWYMPFFY